MPYKNKADAVLWAKENGYAYQKKWRAENPDKVLDASFKHRWGITVEQYEEMLARQDGTCAICNTTCVTGQRLSVDHDHASGSLRGLLCGKCNRGLGHYNDSVQLLQQAIQYLKDWTIEHQETA